MSDNPLQEVEIKFGGKTYRVRPTFEVLVNIEAATGQACRSLGLKVWNGEAGVSEMAAILNVILRSQGDTRTLGETGEQMMEEGFLHLIDPIGSFLTRAQRGHKAHEEEARAAAEKAAVEAKGKEAGAAPAEDPSKAA